MKILQLTCFIVLAICLTQYTNALKKVSSGKSNNELDEVRSSNGPLRLKRTVEYGRSIKPRPWPGTRAREVLLRENYRKLHSSEDFSKNSKDTPAPSFLDNPHRHYKRDSELQAHNSQDEAEIEKKSSGWNLADWRDVPEPESLNKPVPDKVFNNGKLREVFDSGDSIMNVKDTLHNRHYQRDSQYEAEIDKKVRDLEGWQESINRPPPGKIFFGGKLRDLVYDDSIENDKNAPHRHYKRDSELVPQAHDSQDKAEIDDESIDWDSDALADFIKNSNPNSNLNLDDGLREAKQEQKISEYNDPLDDSIPNAPDYRRYNYTHVSLPVTDEEEIDLELLDTPAYTLRRKRASLTSDDFSSIRRMMKEQKREEEAKSQDADWIVRRRGIKAVENMFEPKEYEDDGY